MKKPHLFGDHPPGRNPGRAPFGGRCFRSLIYDVPFEWSTAHMAFVRHHSLGVVTFSAPNRVTEKAGVPFKPISEQRHRVVHGANVLWISYRGDGTDDDMLPVRVTCILQLPEPDLGFAVGPAT